MSDFHFDNYFHSSSLKKKKGKRICYYKQFWWYFSAGPISPCSGGDINVLLTKYTNWMLPWQHQLVLNKRKSYSTRGKDKAWCYFNVPIFVSILWSYGEYKSNLQSNKHYLSKVKIRLEKKFRPVLVIMMVPNKLTAQVLFITAKIALYSLPYPQFT